jgi:hypothetical protein
MAVVIDKRICVGTDRQPEQTPSRVTKKRTAEAVRFQDRSDQHPVNIWTQIDLRRREAA